MARSPAALFRSRWLLYGLGLAGLVGGTLLLCGTSLDVWISSLFYTPARPDHWSMEYHPVFQLLYKYGTLPVYLIALASGVLLLLSPAVVRLRSWRRRLGVVLLTVVVAPWLVTNLVLKDHWGRARPRDCTVFGGRFDYRPVWRPGPPVEGPSFPSGHAAMAFSMFSLAFLFRRRRRLGRLVGAGGATYGAFMGAVRVIQGAHFTSDVLWSAGITLGAALILHDLVFRLPGAEVRDEARHPDWFQGPWRIVSRARLIWCLAGGFLALMVSGGGFLLSQQVKVITRYNWFEAASPLTPVTLDVRSPRAHVSVSLDDTRGEYNNRPPKWVVDIQSDVRYTGLPWHGIRDGVTSRRKNGRLEIVYRRRTAGVFLTLSAELRIVLRAGRRFSLRIRTDRGAVRLALGGGPKARLGPVTIQTRSGRIKVRLGPGMALTGPWRIESDRGDVRLDLRDVTFPNLFWGRVESGRGDVRLDWTQGRRLGGGAALAVATRRGDIDFQGRFKAGPALAAGSVRGRVRSIPGRSGPGGWWAPALAGGAVVDLTAGQGDVRLDVGGIGQRP